MITEEQAMRIAENTGCTVNPEYAPFVRALNLAAAMALQELADGWTQQGDRSVMEFVAHEYRNAAKGD